MTLDGIVGKALMWCLFIVIVVIVGIMSYFLTKGIYNMKRWKKGVDIVYTLHSSEEASLTGIEAMIPKGSRPYRMPDQMEVIGKS